jgi:hypothetical protein
LAVEWRHLEDNVARGEHIERAEIKIQRSNRRDDRRDAHEMDEHTIESAEQGPDDETDGQRQPKVSALLNNPGDGDVLSDLCRRRKRDVDSAGQKDHEGADRQNPKERVAFNEVEKIGERSEPWIGNRKDHDQQQDQQTEKQLDA